MKAEVTKAHDRLFKKITRDKENFRDLVESTFPKELVANLNLDTLELDTNNYIDNKLKEFYSDIVYNCTYKGNTKVKISILYEHKSYKPPNEYLQLLRYMLSIWEFQISNKEELSIVIPVIFYHGKEKWKHKSFCELLNCSDKGLQKFIPDFSYILTDLREYSDSRIIEEVFKSNINKVMALLLKHMKEEEYLRKHITEIFSLVKNFFGDRKKDDIMSFIVYIYYTTEMGSDYLRERLKVISPEGGDEVMTTAMKLIQQGHKEGKLDDKQNVLIRLLDKKFGLPAEDKNLILSINNPDQLDAALDEIITAESLNQVLAKL